ncbi:MAG: Aminoglycoside-2-adenylyltransferase [Actinomycetota bacterium]
MLSRLRVLAGLRRPVWLAGGVAADFHVGRWTRDHHDIDLVTFEEHREGLDEELVGLGFTCTGDRGWITNWTNAGQDPGEVALAYERRLDESTGALVMLPSYTGVTPGIYPGVPGNLSLDGFRTLDDVQFRVASAEDEWVYAMAFKLIRPGASDREAVRHNLALLEPVVDDVDELRSHVGRRVPLEDA